MNIHTAFPSKWLREPDLQGQPRNVIIANVVMEKVGEDHKPVLYFHGKQKALGLNVTNANAIAAAYGPETDGWVGKTITVFPAMTEYQGKPTPCIRVRIPNPQAPPQPIAASQHPGVETGSENPTVHAEEVPPDYTPDLPPSNDIPF